MSKLKFRVWDKKNKIMYNPEDIVGIFPRLGFVVIRQYDKDKNTFIEVKKDLKDFVLMQCTGAYDRKNDEIYEGDIIAYKDKKFVVVFEEGAFGVYYIGKVFVSLIDLGAKFFYEVIGNVYENSELVGGGPNE